jgi:hypothetical protein
MQQIPNYGDQRQISTCVYCSGHTDTADHVPSKVLLDKPYPENLPVVPTCRKCNQGFSLDEEYVACLVECAVVGSVHPSDMKRDRIGRILQTRPALATRLAQAQEVKPSGITTKTEDIRVRNVVLKLARGHAAFELNEPQRDDPRSIGFWPLVTMGLKQREDFEIPPWSSVWPEVGSRAMQRLVEADPGASIWIVVQPGRYRYLASVGDGVIVRIVLSEYLGCEVSWD